jgi:hypothetical protein
MKTLLLLMLLLVSAFQGFSQTKGISYQAVILNPKAQEIPGANAQNNILANSSVSIEFTVLNALGTEEYKEKHTTKTDRYGMINLLIGTGTPISSTDFSAIVWNGSTKKLKVGIDFSGGSNYQPLSEQNLTYMPQPPTVEVTIEMTKNSAAIKTLKTEQATQNTAIALNTAKAGITTAQATTISNTSGINTGDQDISGIAINATAITTLKSDQTTQNTAIALNTAKTGITAKQASDITTNNAKISYPGDQDISGIAINAAGIATLKTEQATQNTAIGLNTAKTGITAKQGSDITTNNAKISYPGDQDVSGIATNSAAITAEKARVTAAEGVNATSIATNATAISTNTTAISAESSRATAAEGVNSTSIATNATAISTEKTRASAAEQLNSLAISAESSRATAAGGVNSASIAANVTSISTNATAISAESSRATAAEEENATSIVTNATAISTIESDQTTQNTAIALNTDKTGIPTGGTVGQVLTINNSSVSEWTEPSISTLFYKDTDGDGYGDYNNAIVAFSMPTGYVANNTDCDDTNAAVNPGAIEDFTDNIDNNCNGVIGYIETGIVNCAGCKSGSGPYFFDGNARVGKVCANFDSDLEAAAAGYFPCTGDVYVDELIILGNNTGDDATNLQYSSIVTNATHTGDVTGATALTITDGAVTSVKILDANVTNAKLDKANIPVSGFGAAVVDVAFGSKRLTGVANPTDAQDAATKAYVDDLEAKTELKGLPANPSNGDMVFYNGNNWVNLAVGTDGQVLTIKNGSLLWESPAVLPNVASTGISGILSFSAQSGGNVLYDGGLNLTAKGVCWSTSSNPTIADFKTNNGVGIGSFTSSLTGLDAGVTYYVIAYATNASGRTGYGQQYSFSTTVLVAPSVSTTSITVNNSNSASGGGYVSFDGGAVVSQRGICWSTTVNPTIANSKTNNGGGTGSFGSSMTGLIVGTTYYVRAYATNEAGTTYGNEVSFMPHYIIGERKEGGVIFYLDNTLLHGMAVSESDVSTSASFGCYGVDSKTSTAFGTGQANTTSMIATCPSGTAAQICNDLDLNGFRDWFLPSKGEIDVMRDNIGSAANRTYEWYWSSSQENNNFGWYSWGKAAGNVWSSTNKENSSFAIRAVRSF